jgi:hypothetical protein
MSFSSEKSLSTIADMYSPLYFWMRNDPQLISTLFTICDPMFLIHEIGPFIVVLGARVVHRRYVGEGDIYVSTVPLHLEREGGFLG